MFTDYVHRLSECVHRLSEHIHRLTECVHRFFKYITYYVHRFFEYAHRFIKDSYVACCIISVYHEMYHHYHCLILYKCNICYIWMLSLHVFIKSHIYQNRENVNCEIWIFFF